MTLVALVTRRRLGAFVQYVTSHGGYELDIYRLLQDATDNWPRDSYWWPILEEFLKP